MAETLSLMLHFLNSDLTAHPRLVKLQRSLGKQIMTELSVTHVQFFVAIFFALIASFCCSHLAVAENSL